jgi:hypothetical protein
MPPHQVDELIHIGRRMRAIGLQSAVGGMALLMIGMVFAAAGYLPPVAGAITQEIIDVAAVLKRVTRNAADEGSQRRVCPKATDLPRNSGSKRSVPTMPIQLGLA